MKKRTIGTYVFDICNHFLFLLFAFCCVYPFYYIILASVNASQQGERQFLLPLSGVTFNNYTTVFTTGNIWNAIGVSLTRVGFGTVLTVFMCTLFAYVVSKAELPGRKYIYRLVVISMYLLPGIVPVYLTFKALNLIDTFWVYVLPSTISAYYVILIKTYIESIDPAIEESAAMDGCGYFRSFLKLIIPLSKPILAAITVFSAVGQWNAWYDNLVFTRSPRLMTLQFTCYQLINSAESLLRRAMAGENIGNISMASVSPESIRMTISVITVLPVMMFYPLLQKNFVRGIMLGAVKG